MATSSSDITTGTENELKVINEFALSLKKQLTTKRIIISTFSVLGLAILLPFIKLAVEAGLGLMVAGALCLGGFFAWRKIPFWIQQHENSLILANQRGKNELLAKMKQEARKNPIEQLQNYLNLVAERLIAYKKFVSEFGAQVKTKNDMLVNRKKQKPDKDYSDKDLAIKAMEKVYNFHLSKVDGGNKAIDELKEAIEDAKFDISFGEIGQLAMQNMPSLGGQDILNEILASEAFDEARKKFNTVISEIEVQIGTINSGNQLEFGEDMSINMSDFHIPSMEELANVRNWTRNSRKTKQFRKMDRTRYCCNIFNNCSNHLYRIF